MSKQLTRRGNVKRKSNMPLSSSLTKGIRQDPIYTVSKRVIGLASLTTSAIVETFSANGIDLAGFPGSASLIAAFDAYRINMVEVEFLPRFSMADGVAVTNTGIFVSVVDKDDLTVAATINDLLEYPSAQLWTPSSNKLSLLKHRFVPRIAVAAYKGAFTGYASLGPTWLDCADSTIVHYGVKYGSTVCSAALIYDVVITANISFRGSR